MKATGQPEFSINAVKAAFVLKGTTLNAWSRERGVDSSHVTKAVTGLRKGPKARQLLAEVMNSVRGMQA